MTREALIKDFISEVREITPSYVPAYCHNLKATANNVYYAGPMFDEEELYQAIDSLLFGKWLSSGSKVHEFEQKFSDYIGQKHSVMVNSGSSANLVMVEALKKYYKWTPNSEIIVSVVGFPTTINPIIQCGLKPVFVDIEMDTLNFDLDEVKAAITSNTCAIFVSPVLGNPPDIDKLQEMCKETDIKIVMDGCDSFGTKWRELPLSNYAVATSCSFYPAHHITTGEGGMVSSNNEEIVKLARSFAWWGRDCYCIGAANLLKNGTCKCRFNRWLPELDYDIDHKYFFTNIGYNLKPLDLQGGIGLAQLAKADKFCNTRKYNKTVIESILHSYPGIRFAKFDKNANVSWFGVPIICDTGETKQKLVHKLETNGIQTRNYFAGNILIHPAYKELGYNWKAFPNANQVLEKVLFIGCSPTIGEKELEHIRSVFAN